MRYSRAHKQQTRRHIVQAAARTFRAKGVHGVAIPRLMGQVGLTHGGFYAHFKSKDVLVAEACAQGLSEMGERLFSAADQAPPEQRLAAVVNAYLSRQHRDDPATGCVLPALAADIARESPQVRHAFTEALEAYLARLSTVMPEREESADGTSDDDVLVLASGMVGAILLARAVDDPALSDRILRASRRFYRGAFGSPESGGAVGPATAMTAGGADRTG
jgi:TetR/AcrR family transcriptional regulator, transcriptional repressor for nem operon